MLNQEMIKIRTADHSEAVDAMVWESKQKAKERGKKIDQDQFDESDPLNSNMENSLNQDLQVDRSIREKEYKKTKLNTILGRKLGDSITKDCFKQLLWTDRLL